jgi:hypothetical protein
MLAPTTVGTAATTFQKSHPLTAVAELLPVTKGSRKALWVSSQSNWRYFERRRCPIITAFATS